MKWGWLAGAVAGALILAGRWRRWGWVERGAGLVAVLAMAAYSSGQIHLPDIEHLVEDLGRALGPWTYLLVGVMAFLETGAFVGLIAPGETTIIVGGVIAGQGEISILALIGLVWACAVGGDVTSFVLGRRLGREFLIRHGPMVKITPERLEHVERFFARHGGKAVFLGRFVGLVRAVAPFIAGSSGMPLRRFLPYDILGAGLWGTTYCVLGYVFWQSFDTVTDVAGKGALALGTTIVLVVAIVAGYRWLRVRENRARARAWLHAQAERPALRPVARVARPVVHRVLAPAARRLAGPLRFAGERFTPGELGLELTTLVAIAAVGAFAFVALLVTIGPGHEVLGSDRRALDVVQDMRTGWLVDVAGAVTHAGALYAVGPAALVAAGALAAWRRWGEIAVLGFGLALVVLLVHVAKDAEDRPRPPLGAEHIGSPAYPSGHSAYAICWIVIAALLSRVVPRLAGRAALVIAGAVLALAIGLTRIYLQAHWLTDVLGGWGLSAAVFSSCGIVALLVAHVRHNRQRP